MNISFAENRVTCLWAIDVNIWVSEAIWGHRLRRQSGNALMLEFLGMAEGMHREGKLFEKSAPNENCKYKSRQARYLRTLIFNNPRMGRILESWNGNEKETWDEWLQDMEENASIEDTFDADFSYLKDRFKKFRDLYDRVKILQKIALDGNSTMKWTQRLLFPIGPNALYELTDQKFARDRVTFTRTGELVYLILSRADEGLRNELREAFQAFFDCDSPRNKLLASLIPENEPFGSAKGDSYLPYVSHPSSNRLAEDLLSLMRLNLPNQDVLEHFRYLLPFHMYLYATETANHWLGITEPALLVCEIPGPKMDMVRRASIEYKDENECLGLRAVKEYIHRACSEDKEYVEMEDDYEIDIETKAGNTADIVSRLFHVDKDAVKGTTPAEVIRKTMEFAEVSYNQGPLGGIQGLGRAAGLTDRRGTNKVRYAPTDRLLRSLILANTESQLEEADLLKRFYQRYRIVIGSKEAEGSVKSFFFDEGDFRKNHERFTRRIIGLGLAKRMSDACTYVRNPYKSI